MRPVQLLCVTDCGPSNFSRKTEVLLANDSSFELTAGIRQPWHRIEKLPTTDFKIGKAVRIANQREFVYPKSYEPAAFSADGKLVTPATPEDFDSVSTGFLADLTSERRGDLVILKGTVSITDFQGFAEMGGEIGQPILDENGELLTENKIMSPKFASYTTNIFAALKPGQPCSVEISHMKDGTKLVLDLKAK